MCLGFIGLCTAVRTCIHTRTQAQMWTLRQMYRQTPHGICTENKVTDRERTQTRHCPHRGQPLQPPEVTTRLPISCHSHFLPGQLPHTSHTVAQPSLLACLLDQLFLYAPLEQFGQLPERTQLTRHKQKQVSQETDI